MEVDCSNNVLLLDLGSGAVLICFQNRFQHPFVKSAKGVSILRDLINEAMDIKLKRQEAQQRELDQDDEENSVSI